MKARGILVLLLVVSLALVPVLVSVPVRASGQYTESLVVYTAGTSAYWQMSFNQLNASIPALASAESTAGLTSYRLVAMSTQEATSDLQVFGVDGFNVLGVPSLPSEALFLDVNASSSSAASAIVSYFAGRFDTTFTLVSSGSGTFVYSAPVNFVGVAAPVLYRLVPSAMKGFAAYMTEPVFVGLAMPSIELYGVNDGSGFSHSITIGAAATSAVTSGSPISIVGILGDSSSTLTASSSSSSSEVTVHALDGVIQSTDKTATMSNDASSFSGTYSLPVTAGANVDANVTISTTPVTAIAYRLFDRGSLTAGQNLTVSVFVENTAKSGVIANVTGDDDWWKADSSVFKLVSGNYSFDIPSIAAGQNYTESYVLQVLTSSGQQVAVPSASVGFQYALSTESYRGEAELGEATLQVNNLGPAVSVTARPTISSGSALGTDGNYTLTVTNNGNSPALNLKVGKASIQSLLQGATQTVNVPITLSNLLQSNLTRTFPLEFSNSNGQTQNVTSNSVTLDLSHAGMVIPLLQVSTNDSLTASSLASRVLNVTYTFTNGGSGTSGTVVGTQVLPPGVTCKILKAGNATVACSGGLYTMTIPILTVSDTVVNEIQLSFARDNYIIPPAIMTTSYEGATLHTFGSPYLVPAGVVLTKSFGLSGGFPGMTSSVTLGITNAGSTPVYNATLSSSQDPFDSASGTLSHTYASLTSQQSESFNYTVELTTGAYGIENSSAATVDLVLGGLTTTFSSGPAQIQVYKPVSAVVTSNPSTPEENHDFTISITFVNSANVTVSDATYKVTIPTGLKVLSGGQVSGKTLTVSVATLGPDSNQTQTVTLSSSMGLTFDLSSSHVTFQYQGSSLSGLAPAKSIRVAVDVTLRYTLPIAVAILIAIAGLVYMRRRITPAVEK